MVVDDTSTAAPAATKSLLGDRSQGLADVIGVDISLSSIRFSGKPILENFNLSLKPSTLTCLLGPSGVGKTSILKSVAGTLALEKGSQITASDGQSLTGRIAYMDQKDLLLPWASVLENVIIGAKLKGTAPDLPRARSLLEKVGLSNDLHARPNQLSGGMRQRVALARTLMEDAPVILVDEPFSALDAITRHRLQAMMCALTRKRTVLMITHDPMEALRMGDQVYVLGGARPTLTEILGLPGTTPRPLNETTLKGHYDDILSLLGMTDEERS